MSENTPFTIQARLYSNVEKLQIMVRGFMQNMDHFDLDEETRRLTFLNTNVEQLIELVQNLKDVEFDIDSEEKANRAICEMLPVMLLKMCCQKGNSSSSTSRSS